MTLSGLAAVEAVLYYAPAFFLKQLVGSLEQSSSAKTDSLGLVYCAALLISMLVEVGTLTCSSLHCPKK